MASRIPKIVAISIVWILIISIPVVTLYDLVRSDPLREDFRVGFSFEIDPSNSTSLTPFVILDDYPLFTEISFFVNITQPIPDHPILVLYHLQGNFFQLFRDDLVELDTRGIPKRVIGVDTHGWLNVTIEEEGPSHFLIDASRYVEATTLDGYYIVEAQSFWARNFWQITLWIMMYVLVVIFGIPAAYRWFRKKQLRAKFNSNMKEEEKNFNEEFQTKF